jgi:hypothetical protein
VALKRGIEAKQQVKKSPMAFVEGFFFPQFLTSDEDLGDWGGGAQNTHMPDLYVPSTASPHPFSMIIINIIIINTIIINTIIIIIIIINTIIIIIIIMNQSEHKQGTIRTEQTKLMLLLLWLCCVDCCEILGIEQSCRDAERERERERERDAEKERSVSSVSLW